MTVMTVNKAIHIMYSAKVISVQLESSFLAYMLILSMMRKKCSMGRKNKKYSNGDANFALAKLIFASNDLYPSAEPHSRASVKIHQQSFHHRKSSRSPLLLLESHLPTSLRLIQAPQNSFAPVGEHRCLPQYLRIDEDTSGSQRLK